MKIDIPRILLHLRWKETAARATARCRLKWPRAARRARAGVETFSRMANHPLTVRVLGRLAALVMWPFARDGYVRWMPRPFSNWTRVRDFPVPRFRRRHRKSAASAEQSREQRNADLNGHAGVNRDET